MKAVYSVIAAAVAFLCIEASIPANAQQDEILARVGAAEIRASDVKLAERLYGADRNASVDAKRSALVDALIELKVLSNAAIEAGVETDPGYQKQLDLLKQQALRSVYLEKATAAAVTDDLVQKTYEAEIAKIPTLPELRVRHILLSSEQEAESAIADIATGKDFKNLAEKNSRDEISRKAGGDLGYASAEQLLPEIAAALASMNPGDVSQEPVKSSFGYHVLKLEDRRDRQPPSFDQVGAQIRRSLEANSAQKILADLKAKAAIVKLIPDAAVPADDGHGHGAEVEK